MRLRARIERMERAESTKVIGRVFQLKGGSGGHKEAEDFLRSAGYTPTPNDLIIHRPIYEPGDKGARIIPVELEFVQDVTISHEVALGELG